MITWLFDQKNTWGYVPNLVKDSGIQPGTSAWQDLSFQKPHSEEFGFLKYCDLDGVKYNACLVSDDWQSPAYYPIALSVWDSSTDYFSYMDPASLQGLKNGEFRVLFYYGQADDPTVEILPSLTALVDHYGIPHDAVKFAISNWLVHDAHPFIYFPDWELHYRYLHLTGKKSWIETVNLSPRTRKTTCLISADKPWRRIFASNFLDLGLSQHSYFSYNNYRTGEVQLDDTSDWSELGEDQDRVMASFQLQLPIRSDDLLDYQHNNHRLVQQHYYNDSYWNIVVESTYSEDTVFLTEKTFKPILNMQPFVVVGNPGSLRLLKHLGYRTFSRVIDERYDSIQDPQARMLELLNVAYSINARSHRDHMGIQAVLQDTLKYNQQQFLKPKTTRIQNFLAQLEY